MVIAALIIARTVFVVPIVKPAVLQIVIVRQIPVRLIVKKEIIIVIVLLTTTANIQIPPVIVPALANVMEVFVLVPGAMEQPRSMAAGIEIVMAQ